MKNTNETALAVANFDTATMTIADEAQAKNNVLISSLKLENFDDVKRVFNASNTPDFEIKNEINKQITVCDLHIEMCDMIKRDDNGEPIVNDETGECITDRVPRIIIIDENGKSHVGTGTGLYNAFKKLYMLASCSGVKFSAFKVEIKQVETRSGGRTFTLQLV